MTHHRGTAFAGPKIFAWFTQRGGVWVLVAIALAVGCGRRYPLVPVTGTVTFAGAKPPAGGTVHFLPIDAQPPARPAMGSFNAEGKFGMTSFRDGDGVFPGRYRIEVLCSSAAAGSRTTKGDPHQSGNTVSHVPDGFAPPELVVSAGGRVTCSIDVKKDGAISASLSGGG